MYIPSHFLTVQTRKTKPTKRAAVNLEKTDTNVDTSEKAVFQVVELHDKRDGEDRRKRKMKPLLDTRSGRDRRHDKARPSIDTKA